MPTFDVEQREITAFEFGGRYILKQYFDNDDLFQQLQEYYNSDKYRFEVPKGDLVEVKQILDSFFYELMVADEPLDYCVVQDKEADSSDTLRNSLANPRRGNYEIYVMKDEMSARQAIEKGATRLQKADLEKEELQWKIGGS
jgi:hypothetical protein